MKMRILLVLTLAAVPVSGAYAHTVDAIDNRYRVEIGWLNEPVLSEETNGIEIFISPLTPCPDILPIECAASQEFRDGIPGLEDDLKMELLYRTDKIKLRLQADHDTDGKYYALVHPTISGFYQVNLLGSVRDTTVSMSMHPPKVEERDYIEFPALDDQILEDHDAFGREIASLGNRTAELAGEMDSVRAELDSIRNGIDAADTAGQNDTLVAASLGIAALSLGLAGVALARTRR